MRIIDSTARNGVTKARSSLPDLFSLRDREIVHQLPVFPARSSRPGPLTPTSADSTGSTYFLSSLPITLAVSASAPAWLEESVSPGSKILWQGIVPAGGSKTLTLNSSMWIRTGNVGVLTMVANGQPVSFSAAPGVYEFTFRQGVKA